MLALGVGRVIGAVGTGEDAGDGAGGVLGAVGAAEGAGIGVDVGVPGTITLAMLESGAHPDAPSCQPRSVAESVPSASFRLISSIEYCPSCCPFRATCICIEVF